MYIHVICTHLKALVQKHHSEFDDCHAHLEELLEQYETEIDDCHLHALLEKTTRTFMTMSRSSIHF